MGKKRFRAEQITRKLRDELLNGEIFKIMVKAKALIEQWRIECNIINPHSSPGYLPPAPETFEPVPSVLAPLQLTA